MSRESKGFTAGEFARMAGVSARMLRHYDKIGLLKPQGYTASGYRVYTEKSLIRLQKIAMLRYLGFSLEQIGAMLQRDDGQQLSESLRQQQRLLEAQRSHIDRILEALQAAIAQADHGQGWDTLSQVIRLTQHRQKVLERYTNTLSRQPASRIHSLYSQNSYGWQNWIFDHLALCPGDRVAVCYALWDEVWLQNAERIPPDTRIDLFDCVPSSLEASRKRLAACRFPRGVCFRHWLWDTSSVKLERASYDRVIASQLFIHAHDLSDYLLTLHDALKSGGHLYCIAMGQDHMRELMELTQAFEPRFMSYNREFNRQFSLENGASQIQELFGNATTKIYDDALLVQDAESICDYLYGVYTNAAEVLEGRRNELYDYYAQMLQDGPVHVTKAQGMIEAVKTGGA